jgi:hypothetical protein
MESRELVPQKFKIIGQYDKQKFVQFNPEDTANWYIIKSQNGKNVYAMYPTLGRKHINFLSRNRLQFPTQPRAIYKTVKYYYIIASNKIYRYDNLFNEVIINLNPDQNLLTSSGAIWFTYLIVGTIVFVAFADGKRLYIYREDTNEFTYITDTSLSGIKPTFLASFGNRIVVSDENSSSYYLSIFNLGGNSYNPAQAFGNGTPIFNQAEGIVRQFAVLHNTLYIFTDYTTSIWSNIPSVFSGVTPPVTFPFKTNTTYNFDYGMQDPASLDVDFGMMCWLAQNRSGQVQVMMSDGGQPKQISTKAINLLFQKDAVNDELSPFIQLTANGFLYQEDNVIFYRLSAGEFHDYGILDVATKSNAVEYNFETEEWHRVIEANGERSRVLKHVYFNNRHLVIVLDENTVYEMSGQYYTNEIRNPDQENGQADDAYIALPFRYERVTPIIHEDDDGEFETKWVQIDFVWGEASVYDNTFSNTRFIVAEQPDSDGNPIYVTDENGNYLITEDSDYQVLGEATYRNLYKPHVELYWSDNGGVMYYPADVMEFSQLGYYRWRMRWYNLGVSRNRVYKLVVVSPFPTVILNGLMLTRRVSGGAS